MKKEAMTIKNTKKLISDKVTQGMEIAKEETTDVMGRVRKVASAATRKGKAAVRGIRS
jgi:gas vesicle protein